MLADTLLTIHSWLRWLLLVGTVVVFGRSLIGFARGADFTIGDRRLRSALVGVFDLQLLLGLSLFFSSGITPHSGEAFKAAMKNDVMRFFAVEHETAALLAIVTAHVTAVRARRAPNDRVSHRRWLVGSLVLLVLLAVTIPWPFLPYGRPLFRF